MYLYCSLFLKPLKNLLLYSYRHHHQFHPYLRIYNLSFYQEHLKFINFYRILFFLRLTLYTIIKLFINNTSSSLSIYSYFKLFTLITLLTILSYSFSILYKIYDENVMNAKKGKVSLENVLNPLPEYP